LSMGASSSWLSVGAGAVGDALQNVRWCHPIGPADGLHHFRSDCWQYGAAIRPRSNWRGSPSTELGASEVFYSLHDLLILSPRHP
jgi:hypothetical protein